VLRSTGMAALQGVLLVALASTVGIGCGARSMLDVDTGRGAVDASFGVDARGQVEDVSTSDAPPPMLRDARRSVDAPANAQTDAPEDAPFEGDAPIDAPADAPFQSDAPFPFCQETTNTGTPLDVTATQGAQWLAWQLPVFGTLTLVDQVELHDNGGDIALLDDDGAGAPGALVEEASGAYQGSIGWRTVTFAATVSLHPGQTYWLAHSNANGGYSLSVDDMGTLWPYFGGGSLSGPWQGPYMQYYFDVRLEGPCAGP
jgi:hypothetical protein